MPIGDIDAREKGAAARYNDGKPNWSYMMFSHLASVSHMEKYENVKAANLWHALGIMQRLQSYSSAIDIFHLTVDFAVSLAPPVEGLKAGRFAVLEETVKVLESGAKKYSAWNWAFGMSWSQVLASYSRHLIQIEKGEELDQESGLPHYAHLICNAMFLLHYVEYYPEGNDLPPKDCF